MREVSKDDDVKRGTMGGVPTVFATHGPKTVPRVDYERIFVLDATNTVLGEYALDDECPLESADLIRSIPISGMRHLVTFYQGEYAFTPFRVDDLWFVILTRGVPRIEERGSIGTLLAAARVHVPPAIEPFLAKREMDLRERERLLQQKEDEIARREQRASESDAQLQASAAHLREMEADLRTREGRLKALRDYAVEMQRSMLPPRPAKGTGAPPEPPAGSP